MKHFQETGFSVGEGARIVRHFRTGILFLPSVLCQSGKQSALRVDSTA